MRLALYTFGMFLRPSEDPANDGFHQRNDLIFELVDRSPGLLARSGYASDPGPESWGQEVYPRFYEERGDGWSPATLSLWQDLEAVFAFTYFGLHAEAMAHGREWFEQPSWPPLVLWWHAGDAYPKWSEGVARHEHLHDRGASAHAFTFKEAYGPDGARVRLDKARLKRLSQSDTSTR